MKHSLILLLALACCCGCQTTEQLIIDSVAWQMQNSGVTVGLRGLCAVDAKIAWASGAAGTVLRTVDGGRYWENVSVPGAQQYDFRDIEAFSAETALVLAIGRPAKIFQTTDGGQTWTEKYNNDSPGIFFDALDFWDRQNGIAVGDPIDQKFVIVNTYDGGETWLRLSPDYLPPALDGEAFFAASGSCLIATAESNVFLCTGGAAPARVFRSTDRGYTWTTADTPILSGAPSQGTFSIAFQDGLKGIVVGGDYQNDQNRQNNAALTTDGGASWTLVQPRPPAGFRSCVAYIPHTAGPALIAVGTSGSDYSTDGGRSWTPIETEGFHTVSFAPDGAGWACGFDGRIAHCIINPPNMLK